MKNKNRILFLLIFVAIAGLFFVSWQGFGNGHLLSYRNIEKGLDLSGGVYIVYEAQEDETLNANTGSTDNTQNAENTENKENLQSTTVSENSTTTLESTTVSETTSSTENLETLGEPTWDEKMKSAISMIQQRLDRKGWTEANVYQEGKKRIRVEIPGVEDVETAVNEIGQTAKLSFTNLQGEVLVEGKDVVNASKAAVTNATGVQEIVVNLEFNEKGKKDFAKATQDNIGKPLLITLDNNIISIPTVNTAITDGKAMISGSFTVESAEELASLIRAGSLPFELKILEMNTVGATLGANALKSSIFGEFG